MNKKFNDSKIIETLEAILDSSCIMAERPITIFLPTRSDGKLHVNRSINYLIKEIEITLNKLKRNKINGYEEE